MSAPVGVMQVVLWGVVRFRYQLPVWPVRVSVAELWVTELAVSVTAGSAVVNVTVLMVVVQESE